MLTSELYSQVSDADTSGSSQGTTLMPSTTAARSPKKELKSSPLSAASVSSSPGTTRTSVLNEVESPTKQLLPDSSSVESEEITDSQGIEEARRSRKLRKSRLPDPSMSPEGSFCSAVSELESPGKERKSGRISSRTLATDDEDDELSHAVKENGSPSKQRKSGRISDGSKSETSAKEKGIPAKRKSARKSDASSSSGDLVARQAVLESSDSDDLGLGSLDLRMDQKLKKLKKGQTVPQELPVGVTKRKVEKSQEVLEDLRTSPQLSMRVEVRVEKLDKETESCLLKNKGHLILAQSSLSSSNKDKAR